MLRKRKRKAASAVVRQREHPLNCMQRCIIVMPQEATLRRLGQQTDNTPQLPPNILIIYVMR